MESDESNARLSPEAETKPVCTSCSSPIAPAVNFCPICGKAVTDQKTTLPASHHIPRAKLWRTASFTAIGGAGGYVLWETFFNNAKAEDLHWGGNIWVLVLAAVGLLALFVMSGMSDVEHLLRHGRWGPEQHERFRLGGAVLKGQSVTLIVAVAIHLYLSLLLHRPVVAVSWAVQFAVFASLTYAWLQALWSRPNRASLLGATAGARWGFWSGLIGSQLSALVLLMTYGFPDASLLSLANLWMNHPSQSGAFTAWIALVMGAFVLISALIIAVLACLSMGLCGYIGGSVVDVFENKNPKWRLSAGVLTLCIINLCLGILGVFFWRMSPATSGLAETYNNILGQCVMALTGSLVGIWISPPLESTDAGNQSLKDAA